MAVKTGDRLQHPDDNFQVHVIHVAGEEPHDSIVLGDEVNQTSTYHQTTQINVERAGYKVVAPQQSDVS